MSFAGALFIGPMEYLQGTAFCSSSFSAIARICSFTRLTNGFSKKFENQWAALALHFAYYNFCRIHKTLRVTPAMESKLTDHVWDLAELLAEAIESSLAIRTARSHGDARYLCPRKTHSLVHSRFCDFLRSRLCVWLSPRRVAVRASRGCLVSGFTPVG